MICRSYRSSDKLIVYIEYKYGVPTELFEQFFSCQHNLKNQADFRQGFAQKKHGTDKKKHGTDEKKRGTSEKNIETSEKNIETNKKNIETNKKNIDTSL